MFKKVERRHILGNSNAADILPQVARRMMGKPHRTATLIPVEPLGAQARAPMKMTKLNDRLEEKIDQFERFVDHERTIIAKNKDEQRLGTLNVRSHSLQALCSKPNPRRRTRGPQNDAKRNINGKADMETQQVSQLHYVNKTAEGGCNLRKVMDFKATLKRRYFFAKEIIQIFKTWGQTEKGRIMVTDVERMSAKIGLPLNQKEARTLLTVMAKGKRDFVNGDEFCEVLYNDGFFEQLEHNGWDHLGPSEDDMRKFVNEQAAIFGKEERKRRLEKDLSKRLAQTFKNQVTGKNLVVEWDEFLGHAKAASVKWDDKDEQTARVEFDQHQVDGKVNLKAYWESLNGKIIKYDVEKTKVLSQYDTPREQRFYDYKNKRELPVNQVEMNLRKIRRVG